MTTAFEQAVEQGNRFYWWTLHLGREVHSCIASSWEDAGLHVGDDGEPITDFSGNTLSNWGVEDLDEECHSHRNQVAEWWS